MKITTTGNTTISGITVTTGTSTDITNKATIKDANGNTITKVDAGKNFYVFPVHLSQVQVQSYQLATDDGGAPFRKQAAEMMKESITEDAAAALLEVLTGAADSRNEVQTAERENAALDGEMAI